MSLASKLREQGTQSPERTEAQFERVHDDVDTTQLPHRRRCSRYKVDLKVSLGSDHNFYTGFVENISEGGVFIATHTLKAAGDILELSIRIPTGAETIRGTGEVRWVREFSEQSNTPPGIGVRFLDLEPGSKEVIEQFLARREPMFFEET